VGNEITITVSGRDKSGSSTLKQVGEASKGTARDVAQAAQSTTEAEQRVERATRDVTEARAKYAAGSREVRDAESRLAKESRSLGEAQRNLASAEAAAKRESAGLKSSLKGAEKEASGLKKTLKSVGTTATGVLTSNIITGAAQKLGAEFHSTVEAASNLNESVNAVNKIFGASAQQIQDWGKQNAESFGLSRSAFAALAVPLGAALKNAGLSMQDTTKWTVDLTKRAADMASVFNTSVPESLEAIQAGLRGEADPLERFGVGLSAAAVEAAALAETGKKSANALTNQEKATARLNLIMKQTAATQGDFASTSDQYANAQRVATARIEDAKAAIGSGLLPVLGKLAVVTGDAAQEFAAMPGPLQIAAAAAIASGAAFVLLGPKIKSAKDMLSDLKDGAFAADTKMGSLARTVGLAAAALTATQTIGAAFHNDVSVPVNSATRDLMQWTKTGKESSDLTRNLGNSLGALQGGFLGIGNVQRAVAGAIGIGNERFSQSEERIKSLDAALASMVSGGSATDAAMAFAKITEEAKKQRYSVDDLKALFPQYKDALDAAANAQEHSTGKVHDNTKALTENAKATETALVELTRTGADTSGTLKNLDFDLGNLSLSGRSAGKSIETFTGFLAGDHSIKDVDERIASLDATLAGMVSSGSGTRAADIFAMLSKRAQEQGTSIDTLRNAFPQYQDALDAAAKAQEHSTYKVYDNTKALAENAKALREHSDQVLSARGDERGYYAAISAATKALHDNGKTLDIHTEKGRANLDALDQIADTTLKWRDSVEASGGSVKAQDKIMANGRATLIRMARQFDMTATQARHYADTVLTIPKVAPTAAVFDTGKAIRERNRWVSALRSIPNSVQGTMVFTPPSRGPARATGGIVGAAGGGPRSGLTLVGEQGPELAELGAGAMVHSAPDTQRMLTTGHQQQSAVIQVEYVGDPAAVEFLRRLVRITGRGDVQVAFGG
jgi:hypothetical protein